MRADILKNDIVRLRREVDAVRADAVLLFQTVLTVLEDGLGVEVAATVLGGNRFDPPVGGVDLVVGKLGAVLGDREDGLQNDRRFGLGCLDLFYELAVNILEILFVQTGNTPVGTQRDNEDGRLPLGSRVGNGHQLTGLRVDDLCRGDL